MDISYPLMIKPGYTQFEWPGTLVPWGRLQGKPSLSGLCGNGSNSGTNALQV